MEAKISQGRPKSRRRKMHYKNHRGTEIRKLGRTKFKFGQLILRKIIKIVATRCHILRLKCTKFNFGLGSAPDTAGAGGAHSAPPDPLAGFKGTSKGRGGREGKKGEVEKERGTGRNGGGI